MTEQQYETILSALADKIKEQETKISVQDWQISELKKALEKAEYHLNPAGKECPATLEIR